MLAGLAGQSSAMGLADCTRITHVSLAGESDHADLGDGRVLWRAWWSQEGTYSDITIAECGSGDALTFRTAEQGISDRPPFERTEKALRIVEAQHKAARVFATLPRIADALEKTARDITLSTLTTEPCACAALYPDLRGDKTPFVLEG